MRRQFNLWRNTLNASIDKLRLRFEQWICGHNFRPARVGGTFGRACNVCGKAESLSEPEYFAQFGEKGFSAIRNW